jgi:hypothetical protein
MPDIISLAERFAQADVAMWGTARDMAERVPVAEFIQRRPEIVEMFDKRRDALVVDAAELVGNFTMTDGDDNLLAEADNRVTTKPVFEGAVTLKVRHPDPEPEALSVVDDIEFDETLIAKMFANLAAHGMTLQDLAG